jgi:hypothetical protein
LLLRAVFGVFQMVDILLLFPLARAPDWCVAASALSLFLISIFFDLSFSIFYILNLLFWVCA